MAGLGLQHRSWPCSSTRRYVASLFCPCESIASFSSVSLSLGLSVSVSLSPYILQTRKWKRYLKPLWETRTQCARAPWKHALWVNRRLNAASCHTCPRAGAEPATRDALSSREVTPLPSRQAAQDRHVDKDPSERRPWLDSGEKAVM